MGHLPDITAVVGDDRNPIRFPLSFLGMAWSLMVARETDIPMTCIASQKTKKEFRAAVESMAERRVTIEDPSIFRPFCGDLRNHPDLQSNGGSITVTNHPKRSWFASVTRTEKGYKVA